MAYEDLTPEQKLGLVVNLKKQQGGLLGGGGLSENVINLAMIMGGLRALGPQQAGQNLASNIAQGVSEGVQLGAALQPKPPLIPAGETAREKKLGEESVTQEVAFNEKMKSAQENLNTYNQLIDVISQADEADVGPLAEQRLELSKFKKFLGIPDDKDIGTLELIRNVSNKLVLDGLSNFKGAISDKEREFLMQMMPGLATSKEGSLKILQIAKRNAELELLKNQGKNLYQTKQPNILKQLRLDVNGQERLLDFDTFVNEYSQHKGKALKDEILNLMDSSRMSLDLDNKNNYRRETVGGKTYYVFRGKSGKDIQSLSLSEEEYNNKFGGM